MNIKLIRFFHCFPLSVIILSAMIYTYVEHTHSTGQKVYAAEGIIEALPSTDVFIYLPISYRNFPLPGKIVFTSNRDGNHEIYTMNTIGREVIRITNNSTSDYHPAWSPDGKKIAYESNQAGGWEIYTMNSDGSDVVQLTSTTRSHFPNWSPDGTKIAFYYEAPPNNTNHVIYVLNADGGELTPLTDPTIGARVPVWSPDGTKIAYYSYYANPSGIYSINPDGTNPTLILAIVGVSDFDWSPDGRFLVISYLGGYSQFLIYDLVSETSSVIPLPVVCDQVSWAPSIPFIVFHGNQELYIIKSDGTDLVNITNNPAWDWMPDWGW